MDIQQYRHEQLTELTNDIGVYALLDLDRVKIYIGQSIDGIRTRVRRHLTSARSDVIANRLLDVWEVAYVSAWPMPGCTTEEINIVEAHLFNQFNNESPLMNGAIIQNPDSIPQLPIEETIQILPDDVIELRKTPSQRLPRQIAQFQALFEWILEVKNTEQLRLALQAHFSRLENYYENFISSNE